jgi:HSP20 family protein
MNHVENALNNVKELYQEFVGSPAPEVPPESFSPFPPKVDPIHHAIEEVERLKVLSKQVAAAPSPIAWAPRADTYRSTDGHIVYLEIPGVAKEDLKVFVVNGECVVRGERKFVPRKKPIHPLMIERPWGLFERRFALGEGTQGANVKATCRDGILELVITSVGGGGENERNIEVE